jgi:uncharacterized protein YegL
MQLNDFKCMPMIDPLGAYCPYDPVKGYDAKCTCSAGTKQCASDARTCPTRPPTPPPTPAPTPPPTPVPTPAPTPCTKSIDLLFLIDDSNSITSKHWPQVQQGVVSIIQGLDIADDKVRVSAATFDYEVARHGFNFTAYHSTASAAAAVPTTLPWDKHKSNTDTCQAMQWAPTSGFSQARGARADAKRVMVVMTDGKPTDCTAGKKMNLAKLSAAARETIHIISIGIGGTYDTKSLQTMATQPYSDNVFGVKSYDPSTVAQEIIQSACLNTTMDSTHSSTSDVMDAPQDMSQDTSPHMPPGFKCIMSAGVADQAQCACAAGYRSIEDKSLLAFCCVSEKLAPKVTDCSH